MACPFTFNNETIYFMDDLLEKKIISSAVLNLQKLTDVIRGE